METGRWQQIEKIYHSVSDAPPECRAALLDEACAGDPDLRREVESLLSASDEAHTFLSKQELKGHIRQLNNEAAGSVIGSTVGRYRVLSFLGAGAMGEVYLAHDTNLDRQVALKLLPDRYTQDPERVARFVREAKAASSLNHPNIITIYEIGQTGSTWFIAAEYIPGGTLRDRMASAPLAASQALEITLQCAGALAAAHSAGVVHRDIKPENIMVRPDGVAKIVDFGLARIVEARPEWAAEATQTGSVMGTPRYMSPEQARGQKLDARTDIFSLGAVLFEMVAGHPAFPGGTTAEVFAALLASNPKIGDAGVLGPLIGKALEKDREARYQTMEELADEFRKFDPEQRASVRPRVIRARWRYAAAVSLVIGLGAVAYAWLSRREVQSESALNLLPVTRLAGSKEDPALSPDGSRIAFSWRSPGTDTQHIYVKPVERGEPVQLTFSGQGDALPAWSSDGRQIAFCRVRQSERVYETCEIYIVPANGGEERKVAEGWRGVSWSPDGKTLALARLPNAAIPPAREAGGIFLLSLESRQQRELTQSHRDGLPVFSPDGRWIAFTRLLSGTAQEIFVVRTDRGLERQLTFDRQPTSGLTWTGDSREIVFASARNGANGSLWRIPVTGGTPRALSTTLRDASMPTISRQGKRLAYRENWTDTNIYLRTSPGFIGGVLGSFSEPMVVVNSSREDHTPVFSPDSERIAFVSNRSGNQEIWVARRDGSEAFQVTSLRAVSTGSPQWSPDGRRIAFDSWASGNSEIYVVDLAGGAPRMITAEMFGSYMPVWSADGNGIYFSCGRSGTREIWKIPADGGEATQITHAKVLAALPSPDRDLVYFVKQLQEGGSIWTAPATGGQEKPVPELEQFRSIKRWAAVLEQGIYFVAHQNSPRQAVRFLSFSAHKVTNLFLLEKSDFRIGSLALSRDGRYALTVQLDHAVDDLNMIENFR